MSVPEEGGRRRDRRPGRKPGSTTPALAAVARAAEAGAIDPDALEALRVEMEQEAATTPPPTDASESTHNPPADVPAEPAVSVAAPLPPVAETTDPASAVTEAGTLDPDAVRITAVVAEAIRSQGNASGDNSPVVRTHDVKTHSMEAQKKMKSINLFGKDVQINATLNGSNEVVLDTAALEARTAEIEKSWLPPSAKQWVLPTAVGVVVGSVGTAAAMVYGFGYERKADGGEQPAQLRAAK